MDSLQAAYRKQRLNLPVQEIGLMCRAVLLLVALFLEISNADFES